MVKRIITLLLMLATQACAAGPAADPYAEGVQAYRAKNFELARQKWEEAIASSYDPSAQNNLAYLTYYGLGGRADPGRAILQWAAAATSGHAEAQWHLGNASLDGLVLRIDRAKAFAWYRCSIANAERRERFSIDPKLEQKIGDDARKSLATLRHKLRGHELQRGETMADECMHENFETLFMGIEMKGIKR